jgi:hypothetical protein
MKHLKTTSETHLKQNMAAARSHGQPGDELRQPASGARVQ